MFQGSFKRVSRVFERSSKVISGKFQMYFKGVCFKEVLKVFQRSFKEVERLFHERLNVILLPIGYCCKK